MRQRAYLITVSLSVAMTAALHAQRAFGVGDMDRVRSVSDPQLSPDGEWVAYTVSMADTAKDADNTDIWMASWDGARQVQLTRSPAGEHAPR